MAGENPGNGSAKTLINTGLPNLKHGKHASWVADVLNIVLAFEVLISLGARDHGTLKTSKPHFSGTPFWPFFSHFCPFLTFRATCG